MSVGQYRSAGITLTDAQVAKPQMDSAGNIKVTMAGATGTSSARVQGVAATGAAVAGNPVLVGGSQGGNVAPLPLSTNGGLVVVNTGQATLATSFVGQPYVTLPWADNGGALGYASLGYVWDGAAIQLMRGDTTGTFTVPKPVTSGGLSIARLIGATSGVIKASAGQLYTATLTNSNAAIRYLQIYNKATAGTLSTDTPVMTIPLPPNASVMIDFSGMGGAFATGISWQFTTDDIAIPTTAGASTDIHGFVTYK
jgi:hypothetical protein